MSMHHLGEDGGDKPFDPAAALAAEGVPVPQPIDIAKVLDGPVNDAPQGKPWPFALAVRSGQAEVNPKEAAGSKKPGVFSVFPRWVNLLVGRVMETGASKYGKFNYRDSDIAASTYEDAMERHAQLWFDGEDNDPESGVSHLAHVIACATLLLDAQATGKLVDNRQKTGIVRRELERLEALRRTLPFPGNLKV